MKFIHNYSISFEIYYSIYSIRKRQRISQHIHNTMYILFKEVCNFKTFETANDLNGKLWSFISVLMHNMKTKSGIEPYNLLLNMHASVFW